MGRLLGNGDFWRSGPRKVEDINAAVVGPRVCSECGRQMVGSTTTCPVGHYQGLDKAGPLTGGGCAAVMALMAGSVVIAAAAVAGRLPV